MFRNKRRPLAATIVSCVFAITAWSSMSKAEDKMTASFGVYPGTTMHMMAYVADAKGFYKEAGLKETTFTPVTGGPMMNSLMGSGAIDFGYQPLSNLGFARDQGLDQVFVAGNVKMPFVVLARSGVKLPNKGKYPQVIGDLKGLTFGITSRGSENELFMRTMVTDAGLNPETDITWIGVGLPPTALPALKAGNIDVYIAPSPAPAIATTAGYAQVVLDLRKGEGPGDFKGAFYQGVVTLRKTAESRPHTLNAIVKAHAKAYCWIHDPKNFKELLEIVKTKVPAGTLTDAQFQDMIKDEIGTLSLAIPASDFAPYNDLLVKSKALKTPVSPETVLWRTVPAKDKEC